MATQEMAKVDLANDAEIYYDWLRGEVERRWKAKADLGSRVHDHVYELSMGNDVDAQEDEIGYLDSWALYVEENGVEFVPEATERVVVHPHPLDDDSLEYGGRDDLFSIHHAGKFQGATVSDYKTGGCYPTQVTLQLAAYGHGLGFAVYDNDGKMLDTYDPLPQWTRAFGVYLRPDGTYKLWEAPVTDATFSAFLDLRRVVNFRKSMESFEKEAEAEWKANQAKQG